MNVKKDGQSKAVKRKRFTLDLRNDVVGRFLLQLPQESRPEFVRRLLEATILSGEAYDIAEDCEIEVLNPKGRSRRRFIQPKPSISPRGEIDRPPKSQSIKQREVVVGSMSGAVEVGSQQFNTPKLDSMHSAEARLDNDRVQGPANANSEQSLADQMQEALRQVEEEKRRRDALAVARGAGSATDRVQATGFSDLASQRDVVGARDKGGSKQDAAPEPVGSTPGLQEKVSPKSSLSGFFGEKPRSIDAGSAGDRAHVNGSTDLVSQRGEARSKESENQKVVAAPEPAHGGPVLQQKVPPAIKLTGFFGERPRVTRSPPPSPQSEEPR